ncbi:dienelactone hydrolase family protein [Pseudoflavitalea rhizosphaerae]|uniref:dienelactone hydrolase family protein n=1 Tax=Pseudoflavitalea rhizosphaerae TaxID=1884793 RepID=UPI000F8E5F57|nr:dienelactone hydrolase family protein [Pseudoflavitalea rhizosphaerae]
MKTYVLMLAAASFFAACNNADNTKKEGEATKINPASPVIKEESVVYTDGKDTLNGYIAYDESINTKRPAILIVPEWWGLTQYPKMRARELAKLGYIAMAVDFYGKGKIAEDPQTAKEYAMPWYQAPKAAQQRLDAAAAFIKGNTVTDTAQIAAIGYCFGGSMVLNAAKLGSNLKGVVSFHGALEGGVVPQKGLTKANILVCNGEADSYVTPDQIAAFKKQLDSVGAPYTFKQYADATHAFSNPEATEKGKKFNMPISYNAAADTASWKDMQDFFKTVLK